MLHQSAAHFNRDAEKVTLGPRDDAKSGDRQRGMWSFLTWSFFLAQALAANEVFAKGLGAGQDGLGDDAGALSAEDAAQKAAMFSQLSGVVGDEAGASAAAQFAAAVAAGALSPAQLGAIADNPVLFAALFDALQGQNGGPSATAAAADGAGVAPGEDPACELPPVHDGDHQTPGDVVVLPDLPLDTLVDLGLELGSGVLNIVGDLTHTVTELAGGILMPVVTIAGDTLDIVEVAAAPVIQLVDGLAQPVVAMVDDIASPVLQSVNGLFASGGTISTALGLVSPLNDLFANGQHTDYGMELRASSPSDAAGSGGSATSSVTSLVSDLDIGALVGGHDDHGGGALSNLLPSVLEEFQLRGSGDGWA